MYPKKYVTLVIFSLLFCLSNHVKERYRLPVNGKQSSDSVTVSLLCLPKQPISGQKP